MGNEILWVSFINIRFNFFYKKRYMKLLNRNMFSIESKYFFWINNRRVLIIFMKTKQCQNLSGATDKFQIKILFPLKFLQYNSLKPTCNTFWFMILTLIFVLKQIFKIKNTKINKLSYFQKFYFPQAAMLDSVTFYFKKKNTFALSQEKILGSNTAVKTSVLQ